MLGGIRKDRTHLRRVRHDFGQGRGKELRRIVILEPSGFISDIRVSRGMRFIKSVACKLSHQFEQMRRNFFGDAVLCGALNKDFALALHFRDVFLTHGSAQNIRAAK